MEVNGDKLVHMENNCLDEVFSKELIQSEIKDSVIEKILHNLEVDVSDIQIENLPDSRLSILIGQKLIPFNKERYTEIENTYGNFIENIFKGVHDDSNCKAPTNYRHKVYKSFIQHSMVFFTGG